MRQSTTTAAALLVVLVVLAAMLVTRPPADIPTCGRGDALPLQPLGIDYAFFRLRAYGRSAVNLAPGDVLCLALEWEIYADRAVLEQSAILIELVGEDEYNAGYYQGTLATGSGEWSIGDRPTGFYPIKVAPEAAPGRYLIDLAVLSRDTGEHAPTLDGRKTLTISQVYVKEP